MRKIRNEWYKDVVWELFDIHGGVNSSCGVYLVCIGGYLHWQTLISPYKGESCSSCKGYFRTNLESVRKDVECTYGILKKQWRILEYGIQYRDISMTEQIFKTCCILHNMMVDEPETLQSTTHIRRGSHFVQNDSIYLDDAQTMQQRFGDERVFASVRKRDHWEANKWNERRAALSEHIEFFKRGE